MRPVQLTRALLVVVAGMLSCVALAHPAAAASDASGGMLAASDGHGDVRLIWFPPIGRMPAGGWQLAEVQGGHARVLVARIEMGSAKALAKLSAQDAASIRDFSSSAARASKPNDLNDVYGVLGLKAFTDQSYAFAAGLAWTVTGASGGPRRYQVSGLSQGGAVIGPTLESTSVDPSIATPLPPAPAGLRGESTTSGVALFWNPAPASREVPVMAYTIERDGGGARNVIVTAKPLVLAVTWSSRHPQYLDQSAPGDTQLTYRVASIDPFGRRSITASASFFALDVKAIAPVFVAATVGQNETTLHWQPRENLHTAGYVVERSNLFRGPYVPLTYKPLSPTTGTFVDHSLRGGTLYYYRVLAVSPQGDLGPPSMPVAAQPRNDAPPSQVGGLHADVGRSRVHLTWRPSNAPIAGYFVERRTGNEARFETLNAKVTPAPLYDDYFGLGTVGTLTYRVISVGFDNKEGNPSDQVVVTLADTTPPAAPHVRGTSGGNGVVTIQLAAAAPAGKTAQILVLRSSARYRIGLIIGDPLAGDAHTFVDRNVEAGQDYWYRFVAVDRNGDRSEPTDGVVVHVGSPPVPTASTPVAKFSAKPFAHVEISFAAPGHGLAVVVERQANAKGSWLLIAGPMPSGGKAIDANPPQHARLAYRTRYVAHNGARGAPSTPVDVTSP